MPRWGLRLKSLSKSNERKLTALIKGTRRMSFKNRDLEQLHVEEKKKIKERKTWKNGWRAHGFHYELGIFERFRPPELFSLGGWGICNTEQGGFALACSPAEWNRSPSSQFTASHSIEFLIYTNGRKLYRPLDFHQMPDSVSMDRAE